MDIETIARACHEANRAICETFGDPSQRPWEDAAGWQRDSAIEGVRYALANPEATPADQHRAWCDHKTACGWTHGAAKDEEARTHPCLVPYDQLPPEQRVKDAVFKAIVSAMRDRG